MHSNKAFSFLWRALWLLMFLNAFSLIWAAYSARPLYADGSYFYFRIFESRWFFWDQGFYRIAPAILQAPAVLLLNLFPKKDLSAICSVILNFIMSLHPMLSLFVCYRILRRFSQQQFFIIFPILSYALTTALLMGYTSIVLPETLSLYWPFFLLLFFRQDTTRWEIPVLYLCTLLLAFCYEIALFLFAFNWVILILRKKNNEVARRHDSLLALAQIAGFCFLLWRLYGPTPADSSHFFQSLQEGNFFGPYRVFGFGLVVELLVILCVLRWRKTVSAFLWVLFFLFGTALLTYFFYKVIFEDGYPLMNLYVMVWHSRTTAGFVAIAIAGLMAYSVHLNKLYSCFKNTKLLILLLLLVNYALLVSFVQDLALTHIWNITRARTHELDEKFPGCNVISSKADNNFFAPPVLGGGWFLPLQTMRVEETLHPKSIFFIEDPPTGEACYMRNTGMGTTSGRFHSTNENYDFSSITTGPIGIHVWDKKTNSLKSRYVNRSLVQESR